MMVEVIMSQKVNYLFTTIGYVIYLALHLCLYTRLMEAEVKLRIVAVSDTHSSFSQFEELIANKISGDIFICAGDFTRNGRQQHFLRFFQLLEQLSFKHKIVIAGNHEISMDQTIYAKWLNKFLDKYPCKVIIQLMKLTRKQIIAELAKRCIYLEHEMVEIEGVKIFGSPFTQYYSKGAFHYTADRDQFVWNNLPEGIDILVTHSPPYGILDKTSKDKNAGSPALKKRVEQIKPKVHIFGHIHESHGRITIGSTTYMNVAKKYQVFEYK